MRLARKTQSHYIFLDIPFKISFKFPWLSSLPSFSNPSSPPRKAPRPESFSHFGTPPVWLTIAQRGLLVEAPLTGGGQDFQGPSTHDCPWKRWPTDASMWSWKLTPALPRIRSTSVVAVARAPLRMASSRRRDRSTAWGAMPRTSTLGLRPRAAPRRAFQPTSIAVRYRPRSRFWIRSMKARKAGSSRS